MELESQTIDLSERLRKLSDRHREYARMNRFNDLPSSDELARQLTVALVEIGEDKKYAGLAALITSAMEGDARYKDLAPLGYALILVAQSQTGYTNAVALSEAVRYLLAHNGYTPIRATNEYEFFVNEEKSLLFALGKEGEMYAVRPKSKQKIDQCIDDFRIYGNSEQRLKYDNDIVKWNKRIFGAAAITATVVSMFDPLGFYTGRELYDPIFNTLTLAATNGVIGLGLLYFGCKILPTLDQSMRQKMRSFHSVHSGIDALVTAFPLAENPARIAEENASAETVERTVEEIARIHDVELRQAQKV